MPACGNSEMYGSVIEYLEYRVILVSSVAGADCYRDLIEWVNRMRDSDSYQADQEATSCFDHIFNTLIGGIAATIPKLPGAYFQEIWGNISLELQLTRVAGELSFLKQLEHLRHAMQTRTRKSAGRWRDCG